MIHHIKNPKIERVALVAAVAMPIMTIPQLLTVLGGHTDGVSLLTWSCYAGGSLVFALLGIKHRERALMVAYIPMFVIELCIIVSLIISRV